MIKAFLFDLDGTLVETEKLKALSYAHAAAELRPRLDEAEVLEAFREVVGRPREEVAAELLGRFGLEEAARRRAKELGVDEPWQVLAAIRLKIYEEMLQDPALLLSQRYHHNIELLRRVKRCGYATGLATMSYRPQATRVLQILGVQDELDEVVTRDDVVMGKPHPEIYLTLAERLGVRPQDCLVIEDSPTGVKSALTAGMRCIAVATEFTRQKINQERLVEPRWIVNRPGELDEVIGDLIAVAV